PTILRGGALSVPVRAFQQEAGLFLLFFLLAGLAGEDLAFQRLELGVDAVAHAFDAAPGLRLLFLPLLAPLAFQAFELLAGGGIVAAVGAEALGRAVAEEEHQQTVVVDGAGADDLAVGIDRDLGAVERAFH